MGIPKGTEGTSDSENKTSREWDEMGITSVNTCRDPFYFLMCSFCCFNTLTSSLSFAPVLLLNVSSCAR